MKPLYLFGLKQLEIVPKPQVELLPKKWELKQYLMFHLLGKLPEYILLQGENG